MQNALNRIPRTKHVQMMKSRFVGKIDKAIEMNVLLKPLVTQILPPEYANVIVLSLKHQFVHI